MSMNWAWALLWALTGLCIGSFLNVLIHRLPRMLTAPDPAYNLALPASHCPHCHTPLTVWQKLPVLSFCLQKGRCAHCHQPISWRYPLVELANMLLWLAVGLGGLTPTTDAWPAAVAWAMAGSLLLVLAWVDWDTTLLPDCLTLPLLWLGLLAAEMHWSGQALSQAFWGCVAGYGSFWLIATAFEHFTGQEGLGGGDFKLLAALGAWLGPWALIPLVFMAALGGIGVGLVMRAQGSLREGRYVPFGPFLAGAAGVLVILGPARTLSWLGLA